MFGADTQKGWVACSCMGGRGKGGRGKGGRREGYPAYHPSPVHSCGNAVVSSTFPSNIQSVREKQMFCSTNLEA